MIHGGLRKQLSMLENNLQETGFNVVVKKKKIVETSQTTGKWQKLGKLANFRNPFNVTNSVQAILQCRRLKNSTKFNEQ